MIEITGHTLTIEDVLAVARQKARVAPLSESVRAQMQASRQWIDEIIRRDEDTVYGVNSGVGPLAARRISPDQARALSRNLVLSCVTGQGEPLPDEIVRAMLLIRANSLALGYSAVRPVVVSTLIEMLNRGLTPYIPAKGSVGASGDLTPLAHIALVLTRDQDDQDEYSGFAWFKGELLPGAEAMARAGIPRLILEAKEGLSLTNGTTFMLAAGTLALSDSEMLVEQAEIAAALTIEGLLGLTSAFDADIHKVSCQPGQIETAAHLRILLEGSRLVDSMPERVQDAYSLRCIPQVIGPMRDVLKFIRERISAALNATSDNPLIISKKTTSDSFRALYGGNFHGQGLAIWLDFLSIVMAELGSFSERRIFRLLTPELNAGLPAMLVATSGLDSGLMISQYTAAALASDNKTLAHPDSVDSIPTSANQEDFVSMGANAARHTLEVISNVRRILAIELLNAAQAIELRPDGPHRLGRGTDAAFEQVRSRVPFLEHDRALAPDIQALTELLASGEMLTAVQARLEGKGL
jgi:histidine ammonia-lyase